MIRIQNSLENSGFQWQHATNAGILKNKILIGIARGLRTKASRSFFSHGALIDEYW